MGGFVQPWQGKGPFDSSQLLEADSRAQGLQGYANMSPNTTPTTGLALAGLVPSVQPYYSGGAMGGYLPPGQNTQGRDPGLVDWDAYAKAYGVSPEKLKGLQMSYESGSMTPPSQFIKSPSSGGGAPGAGQTGSSSTQVPYTAQEYQPLSQLQGRYNSFLDEFDPNTDKGAIQLGQNVRDLAEGQRSARLAGYSSRGLQYGTGDTSALLERKSSDDTTRAAARALSDYRLGRSMQKGEAIRGGLGIMAAPAELALREKQFGAETRFSEANLALQAAQQQMQATIQAMMANRQSPIYAGSSSPIQLAGVSPQPQVQGTVPMYGGGGGYQPAISGGFGGGKKRYGW